MLKLMILLLVYTSGVLSECAESDDIECDTTDKCIKIQHICDGDNDCGDNSDEDSQLCQVWKNKECPRGMTYCRSSNDTGNCVDVINACDDPLCEGNVDQRLCSILRKGKLMSVSELDLLVCNETHQVQCQADKHCISLGYLCDNYDDCEDKSDEAADLCKAWGKGRCSTDMVTCRIEDEDHCVNLTTYCNNYECEGSFDRRLCYIVSHEKLMPLSEIHLSHGEGKFEADLEKTLTKGEDFLLAANHTIRHEKCPQLYSQVGDECISIFFFANITWGEARAFCQTIKGDLYVPKDNEAFYALDRHLKKHNITSDFWFGGAYNQASGWHWIDEKAIELGTHHWALRKNKECNPREISLEYRAKTIEANEGSCYYYIQEPTNNHSGSCVAITYARFFFMSAENCLLKKSPLCKLVPEII